MSNGILSGVPPAEGCEDGVCAVAVVATTRQAEHAIWKRFCIAPSPIGMPDGCQRNAGRVGTQGSFAHRQQFVYLISIARTSSGSRADAGRASLLVSKHQPLDLAYRQVQTLSRQARLEHPVYDGLNHF